jgi:hypothetical protein
MLKVVLLLAYVGTDETLLACDAFEPVAPDNDQKRMLSPLEKWERTSPEIVTVVPLIVQ